MPCFDVNMKGCPRGDRGECAFIGRSNVGKSSLFNMVSLNAWLYDCISIGIVSNQFSLSLYLSLQLTLAKEIEQYQQ